MNIEDYKHLFTPVSEGLPEIKIGETIEVFMIFKYGGGREEIKKVYLRNDIDFGIEVVDFLFHKRQMWEFHTHYLDLSKLTTKERAIKLAEDAFIQGRKTSDYRDKYSHQLRENFIKENKDIL